MPLRASKLNGFLSHGFQSQFTQLRHGSHSKIGVVFFQRAIEFFKLALSLGDFVLPAWFFQHAHAFCFACQRI